MIYRSKAITSILLLVMTVMLSPIASASNINVPVQFPSSALDTWSFMHYPYMWNAGDHIEGTRNLGPVDTISTMQIHLVITTNYLDGPGEVDIDVYLNGVRVGNFGVYPGESVKDVHIDFSPVSTNNGDMTIKYLETNTVLPGRGSIEIDGTQSTVSFNIPRIPPVGGTLLPNNSSAHAISLLAIAALVCMVSLARRKEKL